MNTQVIAEYLEKLLRQTTPEVHTLVELKAGVQNLVTLLKLAEERK